MHTVAGGEEPERHGDDAGTGEAAAKKQPRRAPPPRRPHAWTSRPCANVAVPKAWGDFHGRTLRLKDTGGTYWRNRLEAPDRYVYAFPTRPKRDWEARLVARIREAAAAHAPTDVHLFATRGARNEYYGEWALAALVADATADASELVLARKPVQSAEVARAYAVRGAASAGYRSHSEARHAEALARLFPAERWVVAHEPEALLDLHEPSVVDGAMRDVHQLSRSYTCDFVVASRDGARRLCLESKPCAGHATPAAVEKCRLLRDATLTRVGFVVHAEEEEGAGGERLRWLDVGPLGAPADACRWYADFASFAAAVGVSDG